MNFKKVLILTNCITLLALGYLVFKKLYTIEKTHIKQPCVYNLNDINFLNEKVTDSPQIVMLGDSRIGAVNWSSLLKRNDIINRGINGDKLYCICKRLDFIKKNSIKICFIEGGVMDLYTESVDSIFGSFKSVVDFCKEENVIPVINFIVKVSSKASPLYKEGNRKIDDINKKLAAYVKANNLDYIDLNPQLTVNYEKVLDAKFTSDGSHFNNKANEIWALQILNILAKYNL